MAAREASWSLADASARWSAFAREAWLAKFSAYETKHPELAGHLLKMQRRELPEGWRIVSAHVSDLASTK